MIDTAVKLSEEFDRGYYEHISHASPLLLKLAARVKMLEEECAAMREQLEFAYDGQGYGIEAIKPKKVNK